MLKLTLKMVNIFSVMVLLIFGLQCNRNPTQPVTNRAFFPVTDGTWWQYRQIQRINYLNRHDSTVVFDTVTWTISSNSRQGTRLLIKTNNNGIAIVDTVGLVITDSAICAVGYASLAGTTPLFKTTVADDTTVLVPDGVKLTQWTRGRINYSVVKDTTVIWHAKTYNCKLISEKNQNKLINVTMLGTIGFIHKVYFPDTLISFSDTIVTSTSIELDTFQIY